MKWGQKVIIKKGTLTGKTAYVITAHKMPNGYFDVTVHVPNQFETYHSFWSNELELIGEGSWDVDGRAIYSQCQSL